MNSSPLCRRTAIVVAFVGVAFAWFAADRTHAAEPPASNETWDVVIYGGTSAGIAAAVQASRDDLRVVVVSPDKHLGGLSAGGLGWTDSGNKAAIGGLAREFYERVHSKYRLPGAFKQQSAESWGTKHTSPALTDDGSPAMWVFEPHVAEEVFEDWVREEAIPVYRETRLDRDSDRGVVMQGERIVSLTTESGRTFLGRVFFDATYEGDLLAKAGVAYRVGREANSEYDETWNGNQVGILHHGHHFRKPVDPYRVPGDPSSGLLPLIDDSEPGVRGEGDDRVQAYCFRTCLTDAPENRIPFPKPEGYDPGEYEIVLRVFDSGWRQTFNKFDRIQNRKTDTNNHGPVSFDYLGANYDYPDASYARRAEIVADHERYQKGLLYFLANDPRVPDDVRTRMAKWGLPKDEFLDNGGWPHQIYVREARRMVGSYVMTEHDCLLKRPTPASIGMGSYTIDSHNVRRYVKDDGFVQNEGDIGVGTPGPYEIAYGSVVPKADECENLFVPVCVSATHIAFGSIRMEPVFMILGQSSAVAAKLALEADSTVQDVPYERLRPRLKELGQVLEFDDGRLKPEKLAGTVVDDADAKLAGEWKPSSVNSPFVAAGYLHDDDARDGKASATFAAKLPAGEYEVFLYYPVNENRASAVPVRVVAADGASTIRVDQRKKPSDPKQGFSLGRFVCDDELSVVLTNEGVDGHVIADAVRFEPIAE